MKAIKVNVDYESVLFQNKPLPVMNEALEFLAFYIEDRPVLTTKKYSDEFLDHVEKVTGRRPVLKREGPYENWWGELKNIELEKRLNSKEMSAELNLREGWCKDTYILSSLNDLPKLDKTYLAKNPYGMSGQNFCLVREGDLKPLELMLQKGKVILEPLLDRVYDFSHYVFPDGKVICYQNVVDKKFQYRGTIISDLSFQDEISKEEWMSFDVALKKIIEHYRHPEMKTGFSVDSFVYRENGELKIRFLSEVNYRRTMGRIAFDLGLKFGGMRKWSAFLLVKSQGRGICEIKNKLLPLELKTKASREVIVLSPDGVRYDMFFLSALNEKEGRSLLQEMKELLQNLNLA